MTRAEETINEITSQIEQREIKDQTDKQRRRNAHLGVFDWFESKSLESDHYWNNLDYE